MILVADGSAALINSVAHSQHQQDIVQIFKDLHDPLDDRTLRGVRHPVGAIRRRDVLPRLLL